MTEILAPMQGTVIGVAAVGDAVSPGSAVVVIESMKIECPVELDISGTVSSVLVAVGALVKEGDVLVVVEEASGAAANGAAVAVDASPPAEVVRADLAEVTERHARLLDAARPEAVGQRRRTGQRTARENVDDLCDPDSFVEYGGLVVAAQRQRRPVEDLIEKTPADGFVGGVGTVDGRRTVVMAYDYTVLAGTQGMQSHRKKDRLYELAGRERLPVVLFGEGGGGRPGDTDGLVMTGLDVPTFHTLGRLSGQVPLVAIVSGFCFAGNAALVGCCDVIIATAGSNIGMGGPAMIEGGGLGVFAPEEVGPLDVQTANGVVDIAVADEAEAVAVARRYLSYFSGGRAGAADRVHADQTVLRSLVPEDRTRIYDVRRVVDTITDTGSVLELRRAFGPTMITALARVDGHPLGIVANNPAQLGGAIDAPGADKAARFLQLCDAFGLPVLFLCDTPGIMVGPDAERTALVRHVSRLFVVGANLRVPTATIILRKGYGLGSMTMAGGGFKAPLFCVAWPTGEIGGMGLEGAIRLGYRKELAAIADPDERERTFDKLVARLYDQGKALSAATTFELDDVIDPADSRRWITSLLTASTSGSVDREPRGRFIDPW